MRFPQKCGRRDNSTTYCSNTATQFITKIRQRDGRMDASSPSIKKGDLGLAKNYRGIILTFHSSQNLQCPTTKPHSTPNRQNPEEKPKWLQKKQVHDLTNIDHPQNPRRREGKKLTGDITICRFYQGLRFHSQREDGTNPITIRPTRSNRSSNNDSLLKHQSESAFTGWRHRILRHCSRSTTRGDASPIPLYHLSRLRTWDIDR